MSKIHVFGKLSGVSKIKKKKPEKAKVIRSAVPGWLSLFRGAIYSPAEGNVSFRGTIYSPLLTGPLGSK